jgi:hypothetical protein
VSNPDINALDIHQMQQKFVITGGKDSKITLFDRSKSGIVRKIEPFDMKKKKLEEVSVAKFVPGMNELYSLFASKEGNASIWQLDVDN